MIKKFFKTNARQTCLRGAKRGVCVLVLFALAASAYGCAGQRMAPPPVAQGYGYTQACQDLAAQEQQRTAPQGNAWRVFFADVGRKLSGIATPKADANGRGFGIGWLFHWGPSGKTANIPDASQIIHGPTFSTKNGELGDSFSIDASDTTFRVPERATGFEGGNQGYEYKTKDFN